MKVSTRYQKGYATLPTQFDEMVTGALGAVGASSNGLRGLYRSELAREGSRHRARPFREQASSHNEMRSRLNAPGMNERLLDPRGHPTLAKPAQNRGSELARERSLHRARPFREQARSHNEMRSRLNAPGMNERLLDPRGHPTLAKPAQNRGSELAREGPLHRTRSFREQAPTGFRPSGLPRARPPAPAIGPGPG